MSQNPFGEAFIQGRQAADTSNLSALQQATSVMALQGALQKLQNEQRFRSEIAGAKTDEERGAIAAKYGGPEGVLKHTDRQATIAATQEAAKARIQQAATQFNQMMDLRIAAAKTAQEKLLLEQQKAQGMLQLQAEHTRQTGKANEYNFGIPQSTIATPQVTVGQPPGAQPMGGAPTISPTVSPAEAGSIADPQDRAAALAAMQAGRFSGPPPSAAAGQPPQPLAPPPSAPVAPVPAAAPIAPPLPVGPSGNQDMRDIRAQLGQPPAAPAIASQLGPQPVPTNAVAASVPAPAAPASAPKFVTAKDAPPGMSGRDASQWARDQNKTSILGTGELLPEALKYTATQMLSGDRQAGQGYARNPKMRAALQNTFTTEAIRRGISPEEASSRFAEYEGFKSGQRTVGTRQAQIEIAANVTDQFAPIAIAASEKYDRPAWKSLVDLQNLVNDKTQSPELRAFGFANLSLVNAYARAINPTGVGAQADKEHALAVLNTGFAKGDYKAAVDQLQVEIAAELKAPGKVRAQMRESFAGGTTESPQSPTPARRATDQPGAVLRFDAQGNRVK